MAKKSEEQPRRVDDWMMAFPPSRRSRGWNEGYPSQEGDQQGYSADQSPQNAWFQKGQRWVRTFFK